MSTRIRSVSAVMLFAVVSAVAQAQSVAQAGRTKPARDLTCQRDANAANAYQHCALKLERRVLRLEETGDVIAERGAVRPILLSRFVSGDEPLRLARSYERQMRVSRAMMLVTSVAATFANAEAHWCPADKCPRDNADAMKKAVIGGVSIVAVSIPLQLHARATGRKAISVYNASLER
jgi:hypothetical protein